MGPAVVSRRRPARVIAALGAVAAAAVAAQGAATFLAPAPSAGPSRRSAAAGALLLFAPAVAHADPNEAALQTELPPPVLKDVIRAAPKIQDGVDWLYFELKPALDAKNAEYARKAIGSPAEGAFVSPLESNLMLPLEQLISANVEAEEDGWIAAVRGMREGIDNCQEKIGDGNFKDAAIEWEKIRSNCDIILTQMNKRGELSGMKPWFVQLDASYEDRAGAYLQKKRDMMFTRNAAGSLAMMR
jgi:hypothetical protein